MLDLLTSPVVAAVAAHCGVEATIVAALVTTPAKGVDADLAIPCFQLAKAKGLPPPKLAAELVPIVSAIGIDAVAVGPFLNLRYTAATCATHLLPALSADPSVCLRSASGKGQHVCIDFSSPNIAKHLAFHHIRSTMIGNSLAHLYRACGWDVTRINFLGDWGTAFGRLISGWKREGLTLAQLQAAEDQVTFLNDLYVRASQAAKGDAALEEDARRWSKALEDGDSEARNLWQIFKDASLAEFKRIYALLGVDFDSWKGEAYYDDKMQPVLDELERKGLTSISDGATVVDLSKQGFKKPVLLKRADGGTLYATRDLAAADDRYAEYRYDRSVYVVDLGQALHFKEWFAVAKLLERPYAGNLRHVGFGIVLMWNDEAVEGMPVGWAKGRTRNGKIMLLREVLEEAIDRARTIVVEKNPDLTAEEQTQIAQAVGVGAVVFNDLKNGRTNDVKFKFEDALTFQGETGPYLQFAHARLCSIERKFADMHPSAPTPDVSNLTLGHEKELLLSLAKLSGFLERAVAADEPSLLAQGLLALAGSISSWLTAGNSDPALRVLCPDVAVASARLALVRVARGALGEGLRLLGLKAPERM
jgi:arginyl-tRNA synthetase